MGAFLFGGGTMNGLNKAEAEKLRLAILDILEIYPAIDVLKMFGYLWAGSRLIVRRSKTKNRYLRSVYLHLLLQGSRWYENRYR